MLVQPNANIHIIILRIRMSRKTLDYIQLFYTCACMYILHQMYDSAISHIVSASRTYTRIQYSAEHTA